MTMVAGVGKGRNRRELVVVLVRRGFVRLVVICGEVHVRERMPDFPGRFNRSGEEKQAK